MKRRFSLSLRQFISLLMLAVLFLILWYFSSRNGSISQAQSDWIARLLGAADITRTLSFLIRKSAHFGIFFLTGLFSALFSEDLKIRPVRRILTAAGIALVFAAADELHQHFVSGRSGELRDVLLDLCGAFCGIALVFGFVHHFTARIRKEKSAKSRNQA